MRTTLEIDEDVLEAAKELAARERKTAGKVISELARRGIQNHRGKHARRIINGFEVLPAEGRVVTPQLVQKILEESVEA
jgi:predicted ATPase